MKTALTILGIVVVGGLIWWLVARNDGAGIGNGDNNVACTMDAMLCPDGSYVGRDPQNNCEFRACGGADDSSNGEEEAPVFDKG